jgi:hypothetical protein
MVAMPSPFCPLNVLLIAFFTGAYFVMFAFYLHLLRTRRLAKHRFLNIATIALFILCTIHCALVLAATILGTRLEMGAVFGSERSFTNVTLAAEAVYITTKCVSGFKRG